MMSCLHHANAKCSLPMTSCHLIPTWHTWNVNADDIMVTWFALFAILVMSHLASTLHMCVYGTCAVYKDGASKYLSGLAFTQADLNLEKITTSYFQVLNT